MATPIPKEGKAQRPAVNQQPAVAKEAERRYAQDAKDRRPDITAGRGTRRVNRGLR